MKRMIGLLLTLFIIYTLFEITFNYFYGEHIVDYVIKTNEKDINVHENYYINEQQKNQYYIEITYDDKTIPFKVPNESFLKSKIIKNVNIFLSDNYTCAQIISKSGKALNDIKCLNKNDNVIYYYSSIIGQDKSLDSNIGDDYKYQDYQDKEDSNEIEDKKLFINNIPSKSNVVVEDYKGVYLLGEDYKNKHNFVSLFNQDIYDKTLKGVAGNYYVVANYNSSHEFDELFIVDITNGRKTSIKSKYNISFNSFVQGTFNNNIYIVDRDNKTQYEINLKQKSIKKISTSDGLAKIYNNGSWTQKYLNEVINNNTLFNQQDNNINNESYDKVILVGTSDNGTYYAFKKNNDYYDVYEIFANNKSKTYLFKTTDIDRFFVTEKYIYYLDHDTLKVFGSNYGNRRLFINKELKYNTKLSFGSY